jgi:hypothetical protein
MSISVQSIHPRLIICFLNNLVFTVWGCYPHAKPPTWRTRVSLFVWLLPLYLSGMGDSTSSCTTAGIALRVSVTLKPHHHDKVETPSVGYLLIIREGSPTHAELRNIIIPTRPSCHSELTVMRLNVNLRLVGYM